MQHHKTEAVDKVTVSTKIGYGAGMASERLKMGTHSQMANPIFHDILGIDTRWIGLGLGLSHLANALINPIVGYLSDITQSRYGRRKPWIGIGAILCAISFVALWQFPAGASHTFYTTWFIVTTVVFFLCMSAYTIPYMAMGMELSPDYHERTSVMAYRMALAQIGGVLVSSIYLVVTQDHFTDIAEGMRSISIPLGALILICATIPIFTVKEHPELEKHRFTKAVKAGLVESMRHTLRNVPFLILIATTSIMLCGLTLVNFLSYYITIYYMFDGTRSESAGILLASCGYSAQAGGLIGIPIMAWLAKNLGKRKTLLAALTIACFCDLSKWMCFTPSNPYLSLIPNFTLAFVLTSTWTTMHAMLPDVVDYDELKTHERREGMFSAIHSWAAQASMATALIASGFVLPYCGFDSNLGADQPANAIFRIRLIYTLVPACVMLLGVSIIYFYPLTESRSYIIRSILDRRRQRQEEKE